MGFLFFPVALPYTLQDICIILFFIVASAFSRYLFSFVVVVVSQLQLDVNIKQQAIGTHKHIHKYVHIKKFYIVELNV